jgi:hypothetical protein
MISQRHSVSQDFVGSNQSTSFYEMTSFIRGSYIHGHHEGQEYVHCGTYSAMFSNLMDLGMNVGFRVADAIESSINTAMMMIAGGSDNSRNNIASSCNNCLVDFSGHSDNCCEISRGDVRNIQIVAIMVIIVALLLTPMKAGFAYRRITTPMKSRTSYLIHSCLGVSAFLVNTTFLLHAILKLISPTDYVIGSQKSSYAIDIVFFCNNLAFVVFMHATILNSSQFLIGTLKIMPSQTREMVTRLLCKVDRTGTIAPVLGIVTTLFPFFCYISPRYSNIFNAVYLYGFWVLMVYQGVLGIALGSFVLRQMESVMNPNNTVIHKENDIKIQQAIHELRAKRRYSIFKYSFYSITWILFTVVPSLRPLFTYYYMMFYLVTSLSCLLMIRSIWSFNSSSQASAKAATVVPVDNAMLNVNEHDGNSQDNHVNTNVNINININHVAYMVHSVSNNEGLDVTIANNNTGDVETESKTKSDTQSQSATIEQSEQEVAIYEDEEL